MIKKEAVSFFPKMHHASHELTMLARLTVDKDRNKTERQIDISQDSFGKQ